MFGNLGTHIIQYPTKRWGFVGSLPLTLATLVPATASDIMGMRTVGRDADGKPLAPKFPVFDTEQEARDFAASKAVNLSN